jgi:hypothetical protein
MDAWYEEEEQVFAHARDPYKRVDILVLATSFESSPQSGVRRTGKTSLALLAAARVYDVYK